MPIQRTTCFKVRNDSDVDSFIEHYNDIAQTNQRNGKPYIIDMQPSKPIADPRNGGYNLVCMAKFASMDDVEYYDNDCEAHRRLKAFAKDKVEGPPLALHVEV